MTSRPRIATPPEFARIGFGNRQAAMRVSLRQVLAFRAGQLSPGETEAIYRELPTQPAIQNWLMRLAQVEQQKQLSAPPPVGALQPLEPNLVAQYLEDQLSDAQRLGVEQVCLGSEMHLAEVSCCQQFLARAQAGSPPIGPWTRDRILARSRAAQGLLNPASGGPNYAPPLPQVVPSPQLPAVVPVLSATPVLSAMPVLPVMPALAALAPPVAVPMTAAVPIAAAVPVSAAPTTIAAPARMAVATAVPRNGALASPADLRPVPSTSPAVPEKAPAVQVTAPAGQAGLVEPAASELPQAEDEAELPLLRRVWKTMVSSSVISALIHLVAVLLLSVVMVAKAPEEGTSLLVTASYLEPAKETQFEIDAPKPDEEAPETKILETLNEKTAPELDESQLFPNESRPDALASVLAPDGGEFAMPAGGGQGGNAGTGPGGDGKAEFFGVEATGNKFVYVVDASGSMAGRRFERALEELQYSIRRLGTNQSFYVIFYNDQTFSQFYPREEKELAKASSNNRTKLTEWLKNATPSGGTIPIDGLLKALKFSPDAIFFMTDGEFETDTVRQVRINNRYSVPIHCICFDSTVGEDLLKRIAGDSKGTYRYVDLQTPTSP